MICVAVSSDSAVAPYYFPLDKPAASVVLILEAAATSLLSRTKSTIAIPIYARCFEACKEDSKVYHVIIERVFEDIIKK